MYYTFLDVMFQNIHIYFATTERKPHVQEYPYLFQNNIYFVIHPYIVQFENYTLYIVQFENYNFKH